jgi:ABC-type cobalt transport system substrate-binding protein
MADFFRHKLHLVLLGLIFVLLITLSMSSQGYFGGADNITHYLISHYAFKHPSLFLHAWGRPLYTIFSAPFAQFGLQGAKLLNILLGLLTAWYAFRIARISGIKPAVLAVIFVCFTPLYFMMMPTALTEILFSFVLMLAVFQFLRGKYILSALIISFLPFARAEGFVLLPLFLIALLMVRQYQAVPYLAAGVLFFSILGGFFYKDLFWVFTRFPYPVMYHHPIYHEAGSLWHFFETHTSTIGLPLEILFVAGIAGFAFDSFSRDKTIRIRAHLLTVLLPGTFFLYLALHSVLYWKALGGSLGLDRVLAAVMPMAALVALKGVDAFTGIIGKNLYIRGFVIAGITGIVIAVPFLNNKLPFPLSPEEVTIREAAAWLKSSPDAKSLLFYTDNNVPYYLEKDPWKKDPASCYLFGDAKYLDTIPVGSILLWDAHFGANESKVPLDSLLLNPHQQLINYFRPEKPWITFGGYNYECYITRTIPRGQAADNFSTLDSITSLLDTRQTLDTLAEVTFEKEGDTWFPECLNQAIVHSGRNSFTMDGRTEFSPGLCKKVSELHLASPDTTLPDEARLKARAVVYINLQQPLNPANTLFVISFENQNKPYSYAALNLNELRLRPNHWRRVAFTTPIPAFKSPDDIMKVYIWNPGKQVFLMDDLRVETMK